MSHQDWNTVIFNSSKDLPSTKTPSGGTPHTAANKTALKVEQIAEGDSKLTIKTISTDVVKAIIKHRCALKLSQKDLAAKCCITEALIRNIEQGKEPHNPTVLTKIQKVLCVKLLGDNIGTPLDEKAKAVK